MQVDSRRAAVPNIGISLVNGVTTIVWPNQSDNLSQDQLIDFMTSIRDFQIGTLESQLKSNRATLSSHKFNFRKKIKYTIIICGSLVSIAAVAGGVLISMFRTQEKDQRTKIISTAAGMSTTFLGNIAYCGWSIFSYRKTQCITTQTITDITNKVRRLKLFHNMDYVQRAAAQFIRQGNHIQNLPNFMESDDTERLLQLELASPTLQPRNSIDAKMSPLRSVPTTPAAQAIWQASLSEVVKGHWLADPEVFTDIPGLVERLVEPALEPAKSGNSDIDNDMLSNPAQVERPPGFDPNVRLSSPVPADSPEGEYSISRRSLDNESEIQ